MAANHFVLIFIFSFRFLQSLIFKISISKISIFKFYSQCGLLIYLKNKRITGKITRKEKKRKERKRKEKKKRKISKRNCKRGRIHRTKDEG